MSCENSQAIHSQVTNSQLLYKGNQIPRGVISHPTQTHTHTPVHIHLSQNLPFGQITDNPDAQPYMLLHPILIKRKKGGKRRERRKRKDCKTSCYSMDCATTLPERAQEELKKKQRRSTYKVLTCCMQYRTIHGVFVCIGRRRRRGIRSDRSRSRSRPGRFSGGRARARRGCARGRGGTA